MARIGIISHDATYGNSAVFAEGLRRFADVAVWYRYRDAKQMHRQTATVDKFPVCDHYIIFGAFSLRMFPKKHYHKATIILTDSTYMNNPDKFNKIFAVYGFNVWAMPDLAPLGGFKNIYYQPFIMPKVDTAKTELICHSPYCVDKEIQKGTTIISAICNKLNLPLTIITGKTWRETVEIKARHLICVDQLFRGIGKSGLEAMLLDCAVLSGVKPAGDHLPPICWTDKHILEDDLLKLIFDKERLKKQVQQQKCWAAMNLSPEIMAKKVYDTICQS